MSKESFFLRQTPKGDLIIFYFEADDVEKAVEEFGRSQDHFDRWFKEQIKGISGVDLNQPGGKFPEQILSYGY